MFFFFFLFELEGNVQYSPKEYTKPCSGFSPSIMYLIPLQDDRIESSGPEGWEHHFLPLLPVTDEFG